MDPDRRPGNEGAETGRKRLSSDPRYPRKRSLRACHVCRARKTKCDNVQPTCGFCASLNIPCSYGTTQTDHSSFDPASLEILRQLGQVISSQEDLLQTVRCLANTPSHGSHLGQLQQQRHQASPPILSKGPESTSTGSWSSSAAGNVPFRSYAASDPSASNASTSPAASASVAAVRWFGLLANDAVLEPEQDADAPLGIEGGFFADGSDNDTTPLQQATRAIDSDQKTESSQGMTAVAERGMWQAAKSIKLLAREQILFENFLHRICSWLDLFDPARTFSTRVPHLAVRNAGLLNAILALSSYHQSLHKSIHLDEPPGQGSALQYYYQTLHYVQRAMRYPTYQNSQELMATTLIVSTYEMLRGSRKDWQKHLQGVFWILRSRQIEVEVSSLESTTWWAWLRQDIWVAFRERRRTYSTWSPKKTYADLDSHELASRAVWILAQVINFCALGSADSEGEPGAGAGAGPENALSGRVAWAKALRKMLDEWVSNLTVEFTSLPAMQGSEVFQPRLIHPQCFGLAMQFHHVSRILLCAQEPSLGGLDQFLKRQKSIQESIEIICGIGMTLTEDASSMLSSQCLFIAGIFMQDPRQKASVLEMLDSCRDRCGWPTPSLSSELKEIWEDPESFWRTQEAPM